MRSRHKVKEETSKLDNGAARVDSVWPRDRDEGCLLRLKTTPAADTTTSESVLNEEVCSRWRSAAIYSAKDTSGPVRVTWATQTEGLWLLERLLHHLNQISIQWGEKKWEEKYIYSRQRFRVFAKKTKKNIKIFIYAIKYLLIICNEFP